MIHVQPCQSYNFTLLGIIHPPTPANISLNEDVTLRCTAVAQHIVWRVNGVNVDEILDPAFDSQITLENATGGVTIYTGRLRIRGTTSTNRSVIDCLAIYRSLDGVLSSAISEQVLIQVQGVLDSVKNLHVNIHEKNLQINWDPPYTLNGVSVSRYEVVVGTIIAFLSTEGNITTTNQSIEQLLAYTVSVRPVNLAGIGAETKINARVTPPSTTSRLTVYTQQGTIFMHKLGKNTQILY